MEQNMHLRAIKSFYSAERGQLVTLEDDVLSIVSQVRELYGDQISIQLDPVTNHYHFVAHEEDGTDRLVFTTPELDARALTRLQRADTHGRGFVDPYDAAEREQDELQRAYDEQQMGMLAEAGEELLFHVQKAGAAPFLTKKVYIPRGIDA